MTPVKVEMGECHVAGVRKTIKPDGSVCPGTTWDLLYQNLLGRIKGIVLPQKFFGLETYPDDFMTTRIFHYYAMVLVEENSVQDDDIITKTIPKGTYLCFEAALPTIAQDIQDAYRYCQDHGIILDCGFDFEEYMDVSYNKDLIPMRFCLKLKDA